MDWIIREHTEIELHANSIKMEVGFPQSHENLSFTPCRNKKMLFWRARCNSVVSLWSLLTASSGPPALECYSPFQDLNSLDLCAQSHLFFPIPGTKWSLLPSSMTQNPQFSYTTCLSPELAHSHPEAVCFSKIPTTIYQTTGYHKHNKKKIIKRKVTVQQ